ncbi:PREDICTED: uncharacterized protein LOC101385647 [Odobenus rosmarus divergens]|uniref:Uncharacterized protein LOC101385647 n=1 Tax=Odobenus rosmarus divergens TaxID=9708 RepID=A0A9B0H9Y2_ODORO
MGSPPTAATQATPGKNGQQKRLPEPSPAGRFMSKQTQAPRDTTPTSPLPRARGPAAEGGKGGGWRTAWEALKCPETCCDRKPPGRGDTARAKAQRARVRPSRALGGPGPTPPAPPAPSLPLMGQ